MGITTIEEAKAMEGTEFIYQFSDGDTIPAYVKKFDPEIGLTCYTLEAKTAWGWAPSEFSDTKIEPDGTYCVIGVHFPRKPLERGFEILDQVATGKYKTDSYSLGTFVGCAF